MTVWMVLRKAPPLPFLPARGARQGGGRGRRSAGSAIRRAGEEVIAAAARLRQAAAATWSGPMPFAGWQTAFDPLLHAGRAQLLEVARLQGDERRRRAHPVRRRRATCRATSARSSSATWAAQINRVAAGDTAYPHRDVEFVVNVHTRWRDAADDRKCIALGARPVRRAGAARHRRRVRELHARGRDAARGGRRLRRRTTRGWRR